MKSNMTRRAAFGRLAGAAALALPASAVAAIPAEPDAEIIALSAEIIRRHDQSEEFQEAHIDPFSARYEYLLLEEYRCPKTRAGQTRAFSVANGYEAALKQLQKSDEEVDAHFHKMMAIPARTQPGRAAKVRALLIWVMRDDWRGPARELDWDIDMARALLGEFAGMSVAELEQV